MLHEISATMQVHADAAQVCIGCTVDILWYHAGACTYSTYTHNSYHGRTLLTCKYMQMQHSMYVCVCVRVCVCVCVCV